MASITDLFALALRHWQAGQPYQAEPLLRQVLALSPQHGGALHLLGAIAYQGERPDLAADYFQQAVACEPANAFFQSGLGAAYQALGRLDEAAACHQQALRLAPGNGQLLNNLAITLATQGKSEDARALFEQALRLAPDDPDLHTNLAGVLNGLGRPDEAAAHCRHALRLRPDLVQAHNNLGNALLARNELAEAIASYRQSVRLWPQFAQGHHNLGRALQFAGELEQAVSCHRQALHLRPDFAEAWTHLSNALLALHRVAEALSCAREAVRLRPEDADALNGLGNVLSTQAHLDEAAAAYRQALRLRPDLTPARHNLALALLAQGQLSEALACFREVLRLKPEDHVAHSTYLTSLNYDPSAEPAALLAEHRRWAERHTAPAAAAPHANVPDPERRLRVGYVSPDFRSHAVAYFLEPILRHGNRDRVESICYADVAAPDARTAHLRSLADGWRETLGLSDEQLARLVRQDGIDILVDLAGHTAHNRLRAFARRPAPVQVSYLGYPCTTALEAIAYRLVDAVTDPPGEPSCHTEELVRLSPVFCCYVPPSTAPDVAVLPATRRGAVTFGALHKLEKLHAAVLDLWCAILADVPSARLLLCRNTLRGQAAASLLRQFQERGVEPARVVIRPIEPVNLQHLRVYEEIDISLDAFPWSGHTTACESLWMGVPVVTLRGRRHAERMVASVLSCLGLADLAPDTPEDYRRVAVRLAGDVSRLGELRSGLRGRMLGSPLCDGAGFTQGLEEAYRQMWRRWCARPVSAAANGGPPPG